MATVNHNQSLLDVALQHLGSVSGVFQLAVLNDLSITEELKAGRELIEGDPIEQELVNYFKDQHCIPASGMIKIDNQQQVSGIGYWGITIDFIIS